MNSHQFTAKNFEYGGHLETRLKEWRDEGRSYRWIAAELSKSGVVVRRSTVDKWTKELRIGKGEK